MPRWSSPNSLSWTLISLLLLIWHCLQSPFTFLHSASLPTVLFCSQILLIPISWSSKDIPFGPLTCTVTCCHYYKHEQGWMSSLILPRGQLFRVIMPWVNDSSLSWECLSPHPIQWKPCIESRALLSWVCRTFESYLICPFISLNLHVRLGWAT